MDKESKLRKARLRKGLSVAALSRATGLHPTTIFELEAGRRYAYPKYRELLSEELGVSEEELFGKREKRSSS